MSQENKVLTLKLPKSPPFWFGGIVEVPFDEPPLIYNTGGVRVPRVKHCRYDPCPSDIIV